LIKEAVFTHKRTRIHKHISPTCKYECDQSVLQFKKNLENTLYSQRESDEKAILLIHNNGYFQC